MPNDKPTEKNSGEKKKSSKRHILRLLFFYYLFLVCVVIFSRKTVSVARKLFSDKREMNG